MCKILLSINPEYVKKILDGTKKFEYRTRVAKKKVDKIVIYSTSPVKKVLGEVEVKSILIEKPSDLWHKTINFSGTTFEFFNEYFQDKEYAYAYELGEVEVYNEPKDLDEIGCRNAPQSFIYL